jgi:uncharacterized protein (DUF305 family)
MENKNVLLFSVVFLFTGLFVGWFVWGADSNRFIAQSGMHMMPNGQLMSNNGTGGMSGMMDDMMGGLYGKTGDAFDKAFLEEMIVHHQGAVLMAQSAMKNSIHQEIKDLSGNIISAQNNEITQMKDWLKSWYNINY